MKRCKYAGIAAMLLLLIPAVAFQANAQMPGIGGTSVSGKYVNSGLEISFPEGWTGTEMVMQGMVSVSLWPSNAPPGPEGMTNIILMIADKETAVPPSTMPSPTVTGGECKKLSQKDVKINKISAIELVQECTGEGGASTKWKSYEILTEEKLIVLTYMSMPASNYEEHVAKFEESVKTLKLADVAGSSRVVTVHHQKSTFEVMTSMTNGMVRNITVDEDFTSIILSVETSATGGELTIALPRALIDSKSGDANDEFIVVVDGKEVNYKETKTTSAERMLMTTVPAGTKEIEIVGTQVVPEFPTAIMAVMGAIIATAIAVSRFKKPA